MHIPACSRGWETVQAMLTTSTYLPNWSPSINNLSNPFTRRRNRMDKKWPIYRNYRSRAHPCGRKTSHGHGSPARRFGQIHRCGPRARIYVSPRKRDQQTFRLLFRGDIRDVDIADKVVFTDDIAEWDYGDYEGLVVQEIHARRREKGLDQEREWNIWRDGRDGGE